MPGTIIEGASQVVTVTSSTTIALNSSVGSKAYIEATSGVSGSSVKQKLATHSGGFAVYGPFGSGTVTIFASSGSVTYDETEPVESADVEFPVTYRPSDEGMYANGVLVSGVGISDLVINYIVEGLALPTTGGLANNVTSGVAYLQGDRVEFPGQLITLAASSDNYIDALPTGLLQVSSVANGAGAPAVSVNGLRLGYVVTGASTVTSAVTTGKDSLGNWLGNRTKTPAVVLGGVTNQSAGAGVDASVNFGSPSTFSAYGPEILDNQGVHSVTTNSHRIPILVTGAYRVGASVGLGASAGATTLAIRKNANLTAGLPTTLMTPAAVATLSLHGVVYLNAGDFIYVRVNSASGTALTEVHFYCLPV